MPLDCLYDRLYRRGDLAIIKVMRGDHAKQPWFSTSIGHHQMVILDVEQRWEGFPFKKGDFVVMRIQTALPIMGDPIRIIDPTTNAIALRRTNRRLHSNWIAATSKSGAVRNIMEDQDLIIVVLSDTEALAVEPEGTGWLADLGSHNWFQSLTISEVESFLSNIPVSPNPDVLYWTSDFTFTEEGEWGRVIRFFSHLREGEYLAAATVLGAGEIPTMVDFEKPGEFWAWFPNRFAVVGSTRNASAIAAYKQTAWWNWVWVHVLNHGEPKQERRSRQQR